MNRELKIRDKVKEISSILEQWLKDERLISTDEVVKISVDVNFKQKGAPGPKYGNINIDEEDWAKIFKAISANPRDSITYERVIFCLKLFKEKDNQGISDHDLVSAVEEADLGNVNNINESLNHEFRSLNIPFRITHKRKNGDKIFFIGKQTQ